MLLTNKTGMKKHTTRKTTPRRKGDRRGTYSNIVGNLRGSEDVFWTKVVNGFKNLLSPAFKK